MEDAAVAKKFAAKLAATQQQVIRNMETVH